MIKKNLVVKNGSYTNGAGETKHRWVVIGQLHGGQDNDYITLDAHFNLAAFPRKEGDTRLMVSLFDPKPRDNAQPARRQAPPKAVNDLPFDDEIPW